MAYANAIQIMVDRALGWEVKWSFIRPTLAKVPWQ